MYIPLHVHSEYSLLDGLSQCSHIADRIKEIGSNACALTDHGTISGMIDFYNTMKSAGIKPILGCELYITLGDPTDKTIENKKLLHQVVLAKNYKGWRELLKIVSLSNHIDRFYHKPRVSLQDISNIISKENIVTFSGHLGSILADAILNDNQLCDNWLEIGSKTAKELESIFGRGNFYIEIQMIDSVRNNTALIVAEALREISKHTGIPCVATPDAHYTRRENAIDQRVLLCTYLNKTLSQINMDLRRGENVSLSCFFESDNFHIPSYEEMLELHTKDELENTIKISEMCEEYSILSKPNPPRFNCPDGMTPDEYLRYLCREGWRNKMSHINHKTDPELYKTYGDRVNYELKVFIECGLSSYFLIVRDIIKFCHDLGYITGPGRGCFTKGTNVKMSDGSLKPIKDIVVGDLVIDAYGNKQEVYHTMEYDINEDILELEFENGIIVHCTKDHKFLTRNRGWVEAQYIKDDDDIVEV